MFIQKRGFLFVWFLSIGFFCAASAWSQIMAGPDVSTSSPGGANRSSSGGGGLQTVPQAAHGPTGAIGTGFKYNTLDSTFSDAARDVAVLDEGSGESPASRVSKQKVTELSADPGSPVSNLPPTLTVSTAALLELHAMRKSAVDLCIQLPTKYRTRLPECAEIFKHEIRLQGLAKKHN